MEHGVRHVIFIGGILGEMDFTEKRISWFCNNRGTIQVAPNGGLRGRTKYYDIEVECTREYVERGEIQLKDVSTKERVTDILTKRLWTPVVATFTKKVLSK